MPDPEISVVIPTLGRAAVLKECLKSLAAQSYKNLEIIIVTGKDNDLSGLAQEFKGLDITIRQIEEKGLAAARNAGLACARGKIVSFIDDDVTVSRDWASWVTKTFSLSAQVGGVSGPTIIPEGLAKNRDILSFQSKIQANFFWRLAGKIYTFFVLENQPFSVGRIFKSGAFSLGANYPESCQLAGEVEVDYLEACNMSFRKAALDKSGGFSPCYKGIGDWSEPDLAFRVRAQGLRLIFHPKACVFHNLSIGGVFAQRGKDSYQRMVNFMYFYFKWLRPNTPAGALRFAANLLMLNLYWCYKFLRTGSPDWLSGIAGIIYGLKYL